MESFKRLSANFIRNYKLLNFDRVRALDSRVRARTRKGGWVGTYKLYYYRGSISDCFDN